MTDTRQKINAVLFSVLMVVSVFAATVAFSGAAAAVTANRGAGLNYDTSTSVGQVGPDAVVFQGEEDLTPSGNFNGEDIGQLEKVSGDNSGILLENPIPQDQPTGTYDTNGEAPGGVGVTLQTPRVTDIEVQNSGGGDVTGGILQTGSGNADVLVDYNYDEAEDVEITVEDEDGLEVTSEILATPSQDTLNTNGQTGSAGTDFDVGFEIDPASVDEGQYTITVEGVEDLDFGDATETVTVNISSDQKASLDLESDEVTQGQDVTYNINNSPEGNYHAVIIESNEFRDGTTIDEAAGIFRSVGDVSETGVVDSGTTLSTAGNTNNAKDNSDYAYAVVEIDGGTGVGSIETQLLDDSSVDAELFPAGSAVDSNGNYVGGNDLTSSAFTSDDEQSFDVVEGQVTLESPSGTYVTGSEVDINGTADEGIEDVAIYARDNGDYQRVTVDGSDDKINVEGDNTFEEEDVVLSGEGGADGNDILSLPGSYRIGVIDTNDIEDSSGNVPDDITTSDFNSNVSSTTSIRVTDTELNGTFTTYNGQIATDDEQVDVDGQAPGKDDVIVVFVGPRGNTVAEEVSVDDDDTFSEDDISISDLSEGAVTAHIISDGRDSTFGENGGTFSSVDNFRTSSGSSAFGSSSTAEQVRETIIANTVDDTASDDLIVNEQFRLSDGLTTIDSVSDPVEANGTVEVQGTTNRKPDDNTITVEILDEEDESITVDSTDEWESDGQWSVTVDLSDTDIEPGNYTVESDDGDNTDRDSVVIVEAGSLEEEQPETDTPEPETDTPEPETDTPEPETDTPEPETEMDTEMETEMETEEATTEASGPGFTAAIALIALVAAALLAVRRNN